jgi:hypothetical protein
VRICFVTFHALDLNKFGHTVDLGFAVHCNFSCNIGRLAASVSRRGKFFERFGKDPADGLAVDRRSRGTRFSSGTRRRASADRRLLHNDEARPIQGAPQARLATIADMSTSVLWTQPRALSNGANTSVSTRSLARQLTAIESAHCGAMWIRGRA